MSTMEKQMYDFTFKFEVTIEAYPNQKMREHDRIAKGLVRAFEQELGIPCTSIRDCETVRFRKL